jgi:hypothetical protein
MFDVEFLIPVCAKFAHRLDDFKRYGLVNRGNRSVLVSLVLSNESISGLDRGWPEGFSVEVVENKSSNFVGNLYRYYTGLNPASPRARWLIRLDDDSCTDVDGFLSNLDRFYDDSCPRYLGDLNVFHGAIAGGERLPYDRYSSLLGDYESFAPHMQNEVECGVMSASAVATMLRNESSMGLLRKRAELEGGFGDCVVAIAASMAGVWPVNCPFITRHPLIHEFSLLGGIRNHIHKVYRLSPGESPWGKSTPEGFTLLTKVLDASPNEKELSLAGKRFLLEGASVVRLFEFMDGYRAKSKTEDKKLNWYENEGEILILCEGVIVDRLRIDESGRLTAEGMSVMEIRP